MKFGEKNVGDADKAVRVIAGALLIYAYLANMVMAPWSYVVLLLALVMFATAAMGTCCLYSLVGMNTAGKKKK